MSAVYCSIGGFQVGTRQLPIASFFLLTTINCNTLLINFSALISVVDRPKLYNNMENLLVMWYLLYLVSSNIHCRYSFIKYLPPLTKELSNRSPGMVDMYVYLPANYPRDSQTIL